MSKLQYENSLDVVLFLRTKDDMKELVEFIYIEAIEQVTKAKEEGVEIFCPITVEETSHSHQTDYRFLVHCVAKFISKKLKDNTKYNRVLRDFGIVPQEFDNALLKQSRVMLMLIFNMYNLIYVSKKMLLNRNYNVYFSSKIVEYKDTFYNLNLVTLNSFKIENDYPKIAKLVLKNTDFLYDNDINQVAFGYKKVAEFKRKNEKVRQYFFNFIGDNEVGYNELFHIHKLENIQ